jgi:hypothetical protein
MRMRVGPKNAGQVPNAYDRSNSVSNQFWSKIPQFGFILKIILFSVWVPISEEGKTNHRKLYLRVLMRIAESLYSGGRTPASGSASAYVGSGLTSYFAIGEINEYMYALYYI